MARKELLALVHLHTVPQVPNNLRENSKEVSMHDIRRGVGRRGQEASELADTSKTVGDADRGAGGL